MAIRIGRLRMIKLRLDEDLRLKAKPLDRNSMDKNLDMRPKRLDESFIALDNDLMEGFAFPFDFTNSYSSCWAHRG